jgi:chloramphenicol-sensitive protein RarD
MKNTSYYLAAVAAFTVWGFFSLVLKPLSGYPSLDILFYRVFFSATLLFLVSWLLRRKTWRDQRRHFAALPPAQKKGLLFQLFGGGLFLTADRFLLLSGQVLFAAVLLLPFYPTAPQFFPLCWH